MSIVSGPPLDPQEHPHVVPLNQMTDDSIVDVFTELAESELPEATIMLAQTNEGVVSAWLRPAPALGMNPIMPYYRGGRSPLPLCFDADDLLAREAAEYILKVCGVYDFEDIQPRVDRERPAGLSWCLSVNNLNKDRESADTVIRGLGIWSKHQVRVHDQFLMLAIPNYYPLLEDMSIDHILLIDLCYNISPLRYAWWHNLSIMGAVLASGLMTPDEVGAGRLEIWFLQLTVYSAQIVPYIDTVLDVSDWPEYQSLAVKDIRRRLIGLLDTGTSVEWLSMIVLRSHMGLSTWRQVSKGEPRLESVSVGRG